MEIYHYEDILCNKKRMGGKAQQKCNKIMKIIRKTRETPNGMVNKFLRICSLASLFLNLHLRVSVRTLIPHYHYCFGKAAT